MGPVQKFAPSPGMTTPPRRQRIRRTGPIAVPSGVTSPLAAEGAGGSPQYPRHLPQRMPCGQAQAQRLTFFGTQVALASRVHGNTIAHLGLQRGTWN